MNGEAPGVAGGMDAAAMERAFLMELCTEGGVGGGDASRPPGDAAACGAQTDRASLGQAGSSV